MKMIWPLLLLAPLAAGAISAQQDVQVATAIQAPFAILSGGDKGTATIGASGTTASISVADSAILTADDVLDITSSDSSWQLRAEYVSHTGLGGLTTSLTVSLNNGLLDPAQILIANGAVTQLTGTAIPLATAQDTELLAVTTLLASGSVTFELVMAKDGGGATLRYPVTLTVT